MNANRLLLLIMSVLIAGCGSKDGDTSSASDPNMPIIVPESITVSGISSGAYMAGQLHVAHSSIVNGAGMIAGGPYDCAQNTMQRAIGPCINGDGLTIDTALGSARAAAADQAIDSLDNLRDDPVWLFHGSNDSVVARDIVDASGRFYDSLGTTKIARVFDVPATHGIPTLSNGSACDTFAAPYLQACDYDAAGQLLEHLLGPLQPRQTASGTLRRVDQSDFKDAEFLDEGFVYVPDQCTRKRCKLHVVFHGCQQSAEFVGAAIAEGAGYNEWADGNDLVILYPQVAASRLVPLNPLGCWDWWGYTGDDYARQSGAQIRAIKTMIDRLAGPLK